MYVGTVSCDIGPGGIVWRTLPLVADITGAARVGGAGECSRHRIGANVLSRRNDARCNRRGGGYESEIQRSVGATEKFTPAELNLICSADISCPHIYMHITASDIRPDEYIVDIEIGVVVMGLYIDLIGPGRNICSAVAYPVIFLVHLAPLVSGRIRRSSVIRPPRERTERE